VHNKSINNDATFVLYLYLAKSYSQAKSNFWFLTGLPIFFLDLIPFLWFIRFKFGVARFKKILEEYFYGKN